MSEDEVIVEASANPFALIGWDIGKACAIARDNEAMKAAYQRVFGTTEGRAVLIDLMVLSGAMEPREFKMGLEERCQRDGMVALMAEIFDRAGVDPYERTAGLQAAAKLTAAMEAQDDRRDTATDNGQLDGGDPAEF